MLAVNHRWQIDKWTYKEIAEPIGVFGAYFHLRKNNVEYKVPKSCIVYLVPNDKFFISMKSIRKLMERVSE